MYLLAEQRIIQDKFIFSHPEGKMIAQANACFEKDKKFEDTAARFFDADGDGDPDLYVGSGETTKNLNLSF